ncbi:MAG: transporter substrate-binding domain-containing protein [Lactobacillaceae bacterium]|jgi:cystine transport system substrate-binding protein|nr:transporter substrate-binding domain-containing protein [Lactobacillaceae bacterium]
MTKMIKNVALAAVATLLAGSLATTSVAAASYTSELKTKKTLTIGLEGTYSPFSYRDSTGKLVGYDVSVGKAIAKQLKLKPVFVTTKFDSLVAGLDSQKYDIVLNNMSKNPERSKHYAFGSAYLYTGAVLIVKKGSDIKVAKDLKGATAAQTAESNFGIAAVKLGAKLVASPGFAESMNLIESGKVEATINDNGAWGVYKKANPKEAAKLRTINVTKEAGASKAYPMLNKKDTKLTKAVKKAEKQLKANGQLKKLSIKYFGTNLTK